MTKNRLEAFSDGVFAIAITLLIIEVGVPESGPGELWQALLHAWPEFAAYAVSFFVIGIMWVNHHALVDLVRQVDRGFLFVNLLLLLFVVTIPFTTALFAEYIRDGDNANIAAAVYSSSMAGCAVGFQAMWWWIVRQRSMLHEQMAPSAVRTATIRFGIGLIVYIAIIGLAFISPVGTLVVHFVVALYYMFDQLRSTDSGPASP